MLTSQEVAQRKRSGQEIISQRGDSVDSSLGRVYVLCTFNLDLIKPYLTESLSRVDIAADVKCGSFGQLAQEVLNAQSGLYAANPDVVVLVPACQDLLSPLYQRPAQFGRAETEHLVDGRLVELQEMLQVLTSRLPNARVVVVPFGTDRVPGPHILDPESPERGQAGITRFVEGVRRLGSGSASVTIADWDWLAKSAGWAALTDDRLWYLGRMRLNPLGTAMLSDLLAQCLVVERGSTKKVVAVDLDNTLWGGVVGESGVEGLVLGGEGTGLAFQEFQRELLKWHDAGTLLAICSKNNPSDAWEVVDRHPAMILKREHFAAARINWQDKAQNLRELAAELNVGIDSFAFLDDNPVERSLVRTLLPMVLVPEIPADPAERPAFLRQAQFAQRREVTTTDRTRTQSYRVDAQRRELKATASDLDAFIASLQQHVTIAPLNPATLSRAAQMCQRTNQFNLTTRRYTADELERLVAEGNDVFTCSVRDRFEDSGIVGLAVLNYAEGRAEVDTLLLSCRILGRRIEDAFLAFLVTRARDKQVGELIGHYVSTPKNVQVASFYEDRGFAPIDQSRYRLNLSSGHTLPEVPAMISLCVASGVSP
jgi:FkbH-like protein